MDRPPDINPRILTNVQNNVIAECVRLREEAGVTQQQLADRLGWHKPRVWKWENGRWIDDADDVIAAYANLDGSDPGRIWAAAAKHWDAPVVGSPKARWEAREAFSAESESALAKRAGKKRAAKGGAQSNRSDRPKRRR